MVARTRGRLCRSPGSGQDPAIFHIGDNITVCNPPVVPSIAAITEGNNQSTIAAGGTVIVWGSNFALGTNQLIWTLAGTTSPSIVLNDSEWRYFWDQATGQINATLDPRTTPGRPRRFR